jgi:hypothetical protein
VQKISILLPLSSTHLVFSHSHDCVVRVLMLMLVLHMMVSMLDDLYD